MIGHPIKPETLNLNHRGFIIQANEDIHSGLILFFAGKYSQAAYLYQQAVEKACKFIALSMRFATFNQLKSMGHDPMKFFTMFFEQLAIKSDMVEYSMEELYTSFNEMPENKRYEYAIYEIMKMLNPAPDLRTAGETWVDAYIKMIRKVEISNKEEAIAYAMAHRNDEQYERDTEKGLRKAASLNKLFPALMMHATITSKLEVDTRYPDKDDVSPHDRFHKDSPLVICMPYLLDNVRVAIAEINVLYNDPANPKPLDTVPHLG